MQKIILFLISLFGSVLFYAQNTTGIIKDATTKEPISYATIQISKNNGTISNEEGKFHLNIKKSLKKDSLTVSFIGYKTVSFSLNNIPKEIFLEQDVINLEAVNLDEKQLSVNEIIQKAKENYTNNVNGLKNLKQQIFIRSKSITNMKKFEMEINHAKNYDKKMIHRLNKLIDSIKQPMTRNTSTIFTDKLFKLYHQNKDSAKLQYEKATILSNPNTDFSMEGIEKKLTKGFANLFKDKIFKIKILFFKVQDSLKTDNLSKEKKSVVYPFSTLNNLKSLYKQSVYNNNSLLSEILNEKYYDYKITNNLFYNNEFVYEISYSPKRSKAKYKGKIYISDESFAVIKLDFKMLPNKKLEGKSMKWLGFAYKIYDWNGTLEFYKNDLGKYVPKYINQSKKIYSYMSIPLKFIENTKNKNKLKFKLKNTFETLMQVQSEILFLNTQPLSKTEYKKIKMKKEFPLDKLKKYNPEIWKKYNLLAPTESLLEFKAE